MIVCFIEITYLRVKVKACLFFMHFVNNPDCATSYGRSLQLLTYILQWVQVLCPTHLCCAHCAALKH